MYEPPKTVQCVILQTPEDPRWQQIRAVYGAYKLGALSHETLANYININFGLIQHHGWSLNELDDMHPWEREIYVSLLVQHLEDEELKHKQAQNK